MHFPHTATIQAMTKTGTKYEFADTGTTDCFLQPLDSEYATRFGIDMMKAFSCFIPFETAVKEKNRLVIDGESYGVSGIRTHNYGNLAHKRLILERQ